MKAFFSTKQKILRSTFARKIYVFERNYKSIVIFRLLVENFQTFGKKISAGCQNCIQRVQTSILGLSNFFPNVNATSFKNVNAIGKHRVKKTPRLSGGFSFHFLNMAENNNKSNLEG